MNFKPVMCTNFKMVASPPRRTTIDQPSSLTTCLVTSFTVHCRESLIELIAARVGIDRFCDALSCVNQCDLYTKALQRPQPYAEKPEFLLFSYSFAKLFKSQEGRNANLPRRIKIQKTLKFLAFDLQFTLSYLVACCWYMFAETPRFKCFT